MTDAKKKKPNRQIVGVSLPPATAKAFKAEAARRGLSVRRLFEEMWSTYEAARGKDTR